MEESKGVPGIVYAVNSKEEYERLMATNNYLCIKIAYTKVPKWKFWKRKKPLYYVLMCLN